MGNQFSCSPIDDTGDAADAVPNVTRAIATTSNLDLTIGLESNTAATTVPLVNAAKIPIVTTNGLVAFTKNNYPYYWRLTPSDDANGAAFAVWAVQKGYKNVAVVFQNGIGSEGNLPGLQSAMPKLGGSLGLQLTIPADAASYSSEVARVIASHPDALIWSADPQTTATFMSEYKQLNNGSLPAMVTATDSLTPDFFGALTTRGRHQLRDQQRVPGGLVVQPDHAGVRDLQGGAQGRPEDVRHRRRAQRRRAAGIRLRRHQHHGAGDDHGQDHGRVLLQPVRHPGDVSPKSGATVVNNFADGAKALAAGKQIQYVGVIGPVVFNKYHNAAGEFAANVFAADGSASRVGTISGTKVLGLL